MLAGRVCVPFDPAKVDSFEPSAVPTIRYHPSFSSNRHHLSNNDSLKEGYQNYSVL